MKNYLLLFIFIFSTLPISSQTKILSNGSNLVKLFDGAFFTEGPAYATDGSIYFSDVTFTEETDMDAGIIWKYNPGTGETSLFRSPSGMSNGILFDRNGDMIICEGADYGGRRITRTDMKTGRSKIIAALYNHKPFNSPNDLVKDNHDRIYFTDPRYTGRENIDQPCFGVYRIDPDGKVKLVSSDISMPNGISISPDEKKIYIGCNFEGDETKNIHPESSVYVFDLLPDGNVGNKEVFIRLNDDDYPDGITIDKLGNIYIAIRNESKPGIYIYSPSGDFLDMITMPEIPSNMVFGKGEDKNLLFITAGHSLYKIKLLTEGN